MELTAATTVRRPAHEVHAFWRELENLPTFMAHPESEEFPQHPAQPLSRCATSCRSGGTLRTGRCHVQRYMRPLLERVESGEIDPTCIITHTLPLDDAARGFDMFRNKQDDCEKVVLKP